MTRYYELCNPKTVGVFTEEYLDDGYLQQFINVCRVKGKPAFITMYAFTHGIERSWDVESIVLDRIRVDIDAEDHDRIDDITLARAREAVTKLKKVGLRPRIFFSGNSGFAMEIRFAEITDITNKDQTIKLMLRNMNESLGEILDKQAMLGARQKFRIVNSVHQKTGLHCIPLSEYQLFNLRPEDIMRLARNPVPYDRKTTAAEIEANARLVDVIRKTSEMVADKMHLKGAQGYVSGPEQGGQGWPVRPCILKLIEVGDTSWSALSSVAQELINQNYTDAEIQQALEQAWINAGKAHAYSAEICDREITRLRAKGLRAPHCLTLQGKGLCDGRCGNKAPWAKLESALSA